MRWDRMNWNGRGEESKNMGDQSMTSLTGGGVSFRVKESNNAHRTAQAPFLVQREEVAWKTSVKTVASGGVVT